LPRSYRVVHTYPHPEAVLNGIAYDAAGKRLFVTGKYWPKLFEIKIVPKSR
jgi:glutamine cyclotransferase